MAGPRRKAIKGVRRTLIAWRDRKAMLELCPDDRKNAVFTDELCEQIRYAVDVTRMNRIDVAAKFGVNRNSISGMVRRHRRKYTGEAFLLSQQYKFLPGPITLHNVDPAPAAALWMEAFNEYEKNSCNLD